MKSKLEKKSVINNSLYLEYYSIGWLLIEFILALYEGIKANSFLFIAFGLDSFLEIWSGIILLFILYHKRKDNSPQKIEQVEIAGTFFVGIILCLLAIYLFATAIYNLFLHKTSEIENSSLILAFSSLLIMTVLSLKKRKYGKSISSPSLIEDGMCNITCAYMAFVILISSLLNSYFHLWWSESIGSLLIVYFLSKEGLEGLHLFNNSKSKCSIKSCLYKCDLCSWIRCLNKKCQRCLWINCLSGIRS